MPNRATRGYRSAGVCMRRGNQAAGTRRISFCVALGGQRRDAAVSCVYRCTWSVCTKYGKNTAVSKEENVKAKGQREKNWMGTFNSECADLMTWGKEENRGVCTCFMSGLQFVRRGREKLNPHTDVHNTVYSITQWWSVVGTFNRKHAAHRCSMATFLFVAQKPTNKDVWCLSSSSALGCSVKPWKT